MVGFGHLKLLYIDYSTDNETYWVSMAINYYVANRTYTWTVPYINSTSCLMRLMDSNTTSVFDNMSYSNQKEYNDYLNDAKKPETKVKRIFKFIEILERKIKE